jgi:uncharacterized protein (DUF952 family)
VTTILHLTHAADWDRALGLGSYAISTRGASLAEVGFIHASYPHQLEQVALALFAEDVEPLVVLTISTEELNRLGVEVRDEPGDPTRPEVLYPHVYGALPTEAVTAVRPARIETGPDGPRLVIGGATHNPDALP